METADLDYDLPPELIAQTPVEPRDGARLLVWRGAGRPLEHRVFRELPDLLDPDDLIVVNTSRVLQARLRARKPTGGAVELLLLEDCGDGTWEALARPSRRLAPGTALEVSAELAVELLERIEAGRWRVRPSLAGPALLAALERVGEAPLPPYIHVPADPARYQTVYADAPGSAAAPTAGLHLTPALWDELRARFETVEVDLRIGLDTFQPIAEATVEAHRIHSEGYAVSPAAFERLAAARASGRRVVPIGTTALRVVETLAGGAPRAGRTSIYITPGYRFGGAGALVTNFHLPRSTLLALVMALCGVEETRRIYAEAIARRYRFFSFGDASLLLP